MLPRPLEDALHETDAQVHWLIGLSALYAKTHMSAMSERKPTSWVNRIGEVGRRTRSTRHKSSGISGTYRLRRELPYAAVELIVPD